MENYKITAGLTLQTGEFMLAVDDMRDKNSNNGDSLWMQHYEGGADGRIKHVMPVEYGYLLAGHRKDLGMDNMDFWLMGTGKDRTGNP